MEVPLTSPQAIFGQGAFGVGQVSTAGKWQLPDDRAESDEVMRRLLAGDSSSFSLEKRYVQRDGSVVLARLCVSLVRDPDNLPRCFILVIEDIADRIQAKHALKESEQRSN